MAARTDDELDLIYAAFDEDRRSATPRSLTSWISERPDLKIVFVRWATELSALDVADLQPAVPEIEARSAAIGQAILRRFGLGLPEPDALSSLNESARSRGMAPRQLAERLGIGMVVMAKLNRRLIQAASVPRRLIVRLSEELQVSVEQVHGYLSQQPMLAPGAAYRAEQPPEVGLAEDFSDAVRASPDLSEEQKREWLD